MKNKVILFAKRPQALPDPSCFEMRDMPVPSLLKGQVLVETTYISVDPYMRGRMREGKSYIDPFTLGEPMAGGVVGRVVESEDSSFKKGDYVVGMMPWQLYTAMEAKDLTKIDTRLAPRHIGCSRYARMDSLFWPFGYWQAQGRRNGGCLRRRGSGGIHRGTNCQD